MFSPGFGRGPPSPGCNCAGLVAWSLLAPRSWKPPCQYTPFARSVVLWRWCGWTTVSPLFPHLVRSTLAYGLTVSPLPHDRWSRVHGQASAGLSSGGSVRGYTAPAGWLRGVFPCFAYCPTSSVLKRSSFGFSASSFALSLRDGVTLPGRVCLSPRSERRLFLHLPGVWLESSRWGHPVGSGFVPDLDRNEDFLRTFPGGWCLAFAMGSPISGRVALFCALDRNEGFFHSSILSCFAMGLPCGSGVWFPTLDRNKAGFG